ncbi:MAG: PilZ domain-containing protein [Phycisphaerales bacterium]
MKHDTRRGDDMDLLPHSPTLLDDRESRRVSGSAVAKLLCNSGRVIDVSTRGMRLQSRRKWKTGQRRLITLCEADLCVRVEAECVWCRKIGTLKHTVGLAFTTVSPESAELLSQIVARQSKVDTLRIAA